MSEQRAEDGRGNRPEVEGEVPASVYVGLAVGLSQAGFTVAVVALGLLPTLGTRHCDPAAPAALGHACAAAVTYLWSVSSQLALCSVACGRGHLAANPAGRRGRAAAYARVSIAAGTVQIVVWLAAMAWLVRAR